MKVGDKIKCHTPVKDKKGVYFFKGNLYTITEIRISQFLSNGLDYIIDNDFNKYVFSTDKKGTNYYGKWFFDLKEERKIKLEKLNESR